MKRLIVLMLGLGLAIGSVAVTFVNSAHAQDTTKKKKKKKGGEDTSGGGKQQINR